MRETPKKETLVVEFYDAECGRLYYKIQLADQIFKETFHHWLAGFADFKYWLEAIATNVKHTSFEYDAEGPDLKFEFTRVMYDEEQLTISKIYGETLIHGVVDRKQVVKAFYLGFLNFAGSDKFKREEWEIEYMRERMCKALKKDEEEIIDQLLEFDRKVLAKIFFEASPSDTISFPTAKDKGEELGLFYQKYVLGEEVPEEHKCVVTPNEYIIPDDYDYWTTTKKGEFIITVFNRKAGEFEGMKIDDFRSRIIEEYLEKE